MKLSFKKTVISLSLIIVANIASIAQVAKKDSVEPYVSNAVKYNLKSTTTTTYRSKDSTLNNLELEYKTTATYNKKGLEQSYVSVNVRGVTTNKTESEYDSQDRLVKSTSYDSAGTTVSIYKYKYDEQNRIVETVTMSPEYDYVTGSKYGSKLISYGYKSIYDVSGNLVESISDSEGVVLSTQKYQYDKLNRYTKMESYDKSRLNYIETRVYDSKGGYVVTYDELQTPSGNKCLPGTNRTVSVYDKNSMMLSSVSSRNDNGESSTTKTTYEYKKDKKGNIIYSKSTTENKGNNFYSKSTDINTNKYDSNGNLIETTSQYGGSNSSLITTKYKYNAQNSMIEYASYNGSCNDKPESVSIYTYYEDGKTLKEISTNSGYGAHSTSKYDSRGLPIEDVSINAYGSSKTVYTYE